MHTTFSYVNTDMRFYHGGTVNSGKGISLMLMLPSMAAVSVWGNIGKCVQEHTFPRGTNITVTLPYNSLSLPTHCTGIRSIRDDQW